MVVQPLHSPFNVIILALSARFAVTTVGSGIYTRIPQTCIRQRLFVVMCFGYMYYANAYLLLVKFALMFVMIIE